MRAARWILVLVASVPTARGTREVLGKLTARLSSAGERIARSKNRNAPATTRPAW
jgi:hypothetical protein